MAKKSTSEQPKQKRRAAAQSQESWFLTGWRPYFFIAILATLTYINTKNFGFVGFDDQVFSGNPMFSRPSDIWRQFTNSASSEAYRPVFFATIVLNSLMFGQESSSGFHIINILCHAIACPFVFAIFVRLGLDRALSLGLTAVFTTHPLLCQATAWVPGRNDSFVAIWLFSSFVTLMIWAEKRQPAMLVIHLLTFAISNFTKESAVVFPGVCGVYMLFIAREKLFSRTMIMLVVAWLAIDAVYLIARVMVPPVIISKSYTFQYLYGLPALAAGWRVLPEFVGKMVVPLNQSTYALLSTFSTVFGLVVVLLLSGGVAYAMRKVEGVRWQIIALGGVWIFLFLVLPLMRYQLHTAASELDYLEHRAYVPLVGLLLIIGECIRHFTQRTSPARQPILIGFAVISVLFLVLTIRYSDQFKNGLTFWRKVLEYNPQSALAYNSVGYFMLEGGMPLNEVEPFMSKACELAPSDVRYLNGLAVVHLRMGKNEQAMQEMAKGAQMDSTFSDIVYNLAYMIQQTKGEAGREEAKKLYRQAIRNNPAHFNAHLNLIVSLLQENKIGEAQELYKHGVENGIDVLKARPQLAQYLQGGVPIPPAPSSTVPQQSIPSQNVPQQNVPQQNVPQQNTPQQTSPRRQ
jgi:tetratricopeptide (TPR) repeat protein